MKKRIFLALLGNLLGAVALALVLAWAVGAQGPEPGERKPFGPMEHPFGGGGHLLMISPSSTPPLPAAWGRRM